MRQITQDAVIAFENDRPFKRANTEVKVSDHSTKLLLHDNTIAARFKGSGLVSFTLHGWGTLTTRERLNGLLKHLGYNTRVYQDKGVHYVWHEGQRHQVSKYADWWINSENELEVM